MTIEAATIVDATTAVAARRTLLCGRGALAFVALSFVALAAAGCGPGVECLCSIPPRVSISACAGDLSSCEIAAVVGADDGADIAVAIDNVGVVEADLRGALARQAPKAAVDFALATPIGAYIPPGLEEVILVHATRRAPGEARSTLTLASTGIVGTGRPPDDDGAEHVVVTLRALDPDDIAEATPP